MNHRRRLAKASFQILFWLIVCVFGDPASAEPLPKIQVLQSENTRVPQNLLNLVHAREVQSELGLEGDEEFLAKLRELDADWWKLRIRPTSEQRKIVFELETKLLEYLEAKLGPEHFTRLLQLELQSQNWRILLRPDIAGFLKLTPEQTEKLDELFDKADSIAKKATEKPGKVDEKLMAEFTKAKNAENIEARAILTRPQQAQLKQALGKIVDSRKYERIYPLAPELIDGGRWLNGPVALQELRGRVVLVHFYAFQCRNCVANFKHYRRWHDEWANRGVTVLGIQTPETASEREPELIKKAAEKEQFKFPVLLDLKSENWAAWGNTMWPTVYVVDQEGYIRFWWQGELNWNGAEGDKTIEQLIEKLQTEYGDATRTK